MRFFANYVFFLRFFEVFRVLALLFQKNALFWGGENAGGRHAQKYRVVGHKSVFIIQKALFFGGEKPPEAAARLIDGKPDRKSTRLNSSH